MLSMKTGEESIYLFIHLSIYLYICLFVYLSIYRPDQALKVLQELTMNAVNENRCRIYLSIYLSTYLFNYLSLDHTILWRCSRMRIVSIFLSIYLSIYLSARPSSEGPTGTNHECCQWKQVRNLSIYLYIYLSIYLSNNHALGINNEWCSSIYLSYLSIYLSIHLSIYLPIYLLKVWWCLVLLLGAGPPGPGYGRTGGTPAGVYQQVQGSSQESSIIF